MDLRSSSPSDLIGSLKDRFGFGNKNDSYDGYAEYEDDQYYDHEQYAPTSHQEYDIDQDYHVDSYEADPYDRLEYTTRDTARSSFRSQSPRLVSMTDIRATAPSIRSYAETNTLPRVSESVSTPSSPDDSTYGVPATSYADFVSPYKEKEIYQTDALAPSTGTGSGAWSSFDAEKGAKPAMTSPGLDSLFSPTTSAGSSGASYSSSRELIVVKPHSYDDVSSIARSLRSGALVVLSLCYTDSALSKRVLDFAFGVASALDARVDCVADKTFVLIKGADLTLDEQHRIRQSS